MESIKKFCKRYREVYCYGAGYYGRITSVYLNEQKINLRGFIVSKLENEENKKVLDLPVISLKAFEELEKIDVGILICMDEKNHRTIVNTLIDKGISDYFIVKDTLLKKMFESSFYKKKYSMSNSINVLLYHRVIDLPIDTWKLAISPKIFKEHIEFISQHYNIISAEDDWTNIQNNGVVITFDDGYADVYKNALPILEYYKVPATVFVSTCNLDTEDEFWWDELERIIFFKGIDINQLDIFGKTLPITTIEDKIKACYYIHPYLKSMCHAERKEVLNKMAIKLNSMKNGRKTHKSLSIDELKKLSNSPYITIGGHTVTHSCLANESTEIQKWEIEHSKEAIEKIIGKPLTVFSYPFGQKNDFTNETTYIVKECGYKKIFTTFEGMVNNPYGLDNIPRNNIAQTTNIEESKRQIRIIETLFSDGYI